MQRPFIFCFMQTSIDGKIIGNFMDLAESKQSGQTYIQIFRDSLLGRVDGLKMRGWLAGRISSDDNFTFYRKPNTLKKFEPVTDGDFFAIDDSASYYISIDPRGVLAWKDNTIRWAGVKARVLEVLTDNASDAYKAMLRRLQIPYIICGHDKLDLPLMMTKLKVQCGFDKLMLSGGGILNWSMIQHGLCDEVSYIVTPAADGSAMTQSMFMQKEGISDDKPVGFTLLESKVVGEGTVWLRYKVNNALK